MNVIGTLIRKHWLESRWLGGLSVLAIFSFALLGTYQAQQVERMLGSGDMSKAPRRLGLVKALGGEAMDFSTTALEVCWWNHPVVIILILSWAVSRGSAAVAGEIERGTIDIILSRSVSRFEYLASQVAFALMGLVGLAFGLIAGCLVGSLFFTLKAPPTLLTLLKPATMVVTLGMAVYGYTLPFSTIDVVRWRPALAGSAITLGGLIAWSVAPFYELTWLRKVSVFEAYAPVTVALKGEPLAYNATVLSLVFVAGLVVSFWSFSERDLPSGS